MIARDLVVKKEVQGMKVIKCRKKKIKFVFKILMLCFAAYVIVTFVDQQLQINAKKTEYEQKTQALAMQKIKNEEMSNLAAQDPERMEEMAREYLNYAKDGERVFFNIAGN